MSSNLLSVVWYDEYDYAYNSQVFEYQKLY